MRPVPVRASLRMELVQGLTEYRASALLRSERQAQERGLLREA
jgi:hypothetical protein